MVRIRRFEEKMVELNAQGMLPGLPHAYIGEEAIGTGVIAHLRADDLILTTHRGHGHCIAKGLPLDRMAAEMLGKRTGLCKGKGGSFHLSDLDMGVAGAMGIVGSGIPIAAGVGLALRMKKTDRITVCFFGDGAANQGAFHEGLNIAALWKLPVVYVCENNLYGFSVSVSKSTSVKDIGCRGTAYNIPWCVVDGNDVIAVYEAASEAIEQARKGKGPTLMECKTYRWRGHHEGDPDRGLLYRTREEMQAWEEKCPIKRLKVTLYDKGILTEKIDDQIEKEIAEEIETAVNFAVKSPLPEPTEALNDIFA